MELIIDNNILFSLMKPDSMNSKIFLYLNIKFKCKFIAPQFLIWEFNKYESECLEKSILSKEEFKYRKQEIISKISFIDFIKYKEFLKEAVKISPDIDDAPYFALSLKTGIPLWSNDAILKKQDKIKVLSTKDIIEIFL